MRISDWSSDVCSSDLFADHDRGLHFVLRIHNHRTWFGRSRLSLSCPDQWLILVNNAYFFGLRSDHKESGSTGLDAPFAIIPHISNIFGVQFPRSARIVRKSGVKGKSV